MPPEADFYKQRSRTTHSTGLVIKKPFINIACSPVYSGVGCCIEKVSMRIVLSFILGCVGGAISGALLLGIPAYTDTEYGLLGPKRAWAPLAIIMGLILGGISGAVIGLLIGILKADKGGGAVIGAGVGLIILLTLFALGLNPALDREVAIFGMLSIPIGAIVGLFVSTITNLRRNTEMTEDNRVKN